MAIRGESTIEIDAPLERCWDLVTDPEGTVAWQDSLKRAVILERDADGEPTLVETHIDAVAKEVKVTLRFDWDEHEQLRWHKESGDIKDVKGAWTLEDLGEDRTRATYMLEIDPGRVLGMLARGPLGDQVKKQLTKQPPQGLKRAAEA
jgi:carbon monoxide dehydrogenase subunit G